MRGCSPRLHVHAEVTRSRPESELLSWVLLIVGSLSVHLTMRGNPVLLANFSQNASSHNQYCSVTLTPAKKERCNGESYPTSLDSAGLILGHSCARRRTFARSRRHLSEVKSDSPSTISAWIGAAGAFQLFVNGTDVLHDDHYRGHDVDRLAATARIRPGYNDFTVKVCSTDNSPVLSMRLADSEGNPDPSIETTNDPMIPVTTRRSTMESEKRKKTSGIKVDDGRKYAPTPLARADQLVAQTTNVRGPIQIFNALVASKRPKSEDLADFAEYLQVTKGDDPSQHQARDLATQAAEQQPSVAHYLLASALAEDRNQRARWLEKAEALPDVGLTDKLRLVLARAAHERSGPHPQGALPWFKQAMLLDPDNVEATVQLADLYGVFGLDQTALVLIDSALQRLPSRCAATRRQSRKAAQVGSVNRSFRGGTTVRQSSLRRRCMVRENGGSCRYLGRTLRLLTGGQGD